MRLFFFGPKLLHGLIRPGISFGREDLHHFTAKPSSSANAIDVDHSFVYVIEGGGLCKIGRTTNPAARLTQLQYQSSSPLRFAWIGAPKGDTIAIEREAHQMLNKYRRNGEWFAVTPEVAVGAIHSVAFKRGQPVLDLDANQAAKIVQIAGQLDRPPSTVFDRVLAGLIQVGLAIFIAGWVLIALARFARF